MATVYALGLSPAVAFPIMMGVCTFSVPIGSMEFIKFGQYGRKITLASVTAGVLGVLAAIFLVKSFNGDPDPMGCGSGCPLYLTHYVLRRI